LRGHDLKQTLLVMEIGVKRAGCDSAIRQAEYPKALANPAEALRAVIRVDQLDTSCVPIPQERLHSAQKCGRLRDSPEVLQMP
jgi:hypothetical protein